MEMCYNFDFGKGNIELNGLLAQAAVDRGYLDPNDWEKVCTLTWLRVQTLVNDLYKLTAENATSKLDLYKLGVLTIWLATHAWQDEMVFA